MNTGATSSPSYLNFPRFAGQFGCRDKTERKGNFVAVGRSPGNENRRWHGTQKNATLGIKESRISARIRDAPCVASLRPHSTSGLSAVRLIGGFMELEFTLLRLHQSSSSTLMNLTRAPI